MVRVEPETQHSTPLLILNRQQFGKHDKENKLWWWRHTTRRMSLPTKTLGKDQGMEPETPNPWIDFHIKTVNNSVNATKKANSSNDETSPDVYYYRQRRQEKTREWNRRLQTHESTSTLKPSTIRQSRDNPATRWKHTLVWRNSNRCMWLPTKTLERLVNGARGSHSPHPITWWNDENIHWCDKTVTSAYDCRQRR